MSFDIDKLRALLARKEGRHWYPRGRFISLVPDDSPYSASNPFRHLANFPDHDMTELACAAVNTLPELLAIAEAACAIRDSGIVVGDSPYASAPVELMTALIAVVGAVRKAGS